MSATPYTGLLPCPFCEGDAFIGTIRYSESPYCDDRCKNQLDYWSVNCAKCCATKRGIAGYPSEAEAIAAWNTRPEAAEAISSLLKRVGELEGVLIAARKLTCEACDTGFAEAECRAIYAHNGKITAALNSDASQTLSSDTLKGGE